MHTHFTIGSYLVNLLHSTFNQFRNTGRTDAMLESHIPTGNLVIDAKCNTLKIYGCRGQLVIANNVDALPYLEHRQLNTEFKFVRDL